MQETKPKKQRSSPYPAVSLDKAIEDIKEMRAKIGNAACDRDTAATALGFSGVNGTSAPRIATLVHFGFLERDGNRYIQTPLADSICLPTSDADYSSAVKAALVHPKLYSALIDGYEGQAIPTMLANILTRDHGISEKVAGGVVKNFRKSLEVAGFIKNGAISSQDEHPPMNPTEKQEPHAPNNSQQAPSEMIPDSTPDYLIRLPLGICIQFPEKLSFLVGTGVFANPIEELHKIAESLEAQYGEKAENKEAE